MKFERKGISTAAMGAIAVVAIIVVGAGAYLAASGGSKTTTVTSTSTEMASGSTVTTSSVVTSVITSNGVPTTVTSTLGTTVTSVATSVSTSIQTTIAQPTLPQTLPSPSSPLSEAGSSLLYPLFQFWAANFTKLYSNVPVNTAAGGSGAGLSGIEQNTINIGASDPYMTSAQSGAYPAILNIPVAISSQAVNYNLPGMSTSTHINFTGAVLAAIYNGKITYWDDPAIKALQSASVASQLPHQIIVPLHRSDSSGDTNLFTTYLTDSAPTNWTLGAGNTVNWASVPSAQADNGNSGMLTGCQQTSYCIAYIGVSYQTQATADGLGSAALQNQAGAFVTLTSATVQSAVNAQTSNIPPNEKVTLIYGPGATSYPIVNFEYVLVQQHSGNANLAADIQALLWYATTTGQSQYFLNSAATGNLGFLPLPAAVAQLSWAQINTITA